MTWRLLLLDHAAFSLVSVIDIERGTSYGSYMVEMRNSAISNARLWCSGRSLCHAQPALLLVKWSVGGAVAQGSLSWGTQWCATLRTMIAPAESAVAR